MRGMKRPAIFDSTPDFSSKDSYSDRLVRPPPFFAPLAAEQSLQRQPLDVQRAESSRQHVRALNNQFANWIQTQLQNHPDELWEDGVQDYLNHAKGIMETFSDIVGWLKENSAKVVSAGEHQSADAQVKITAENDESSQLARPGFPKVATGIFGASWPSGSFGNNNSAPFSFRGSQVSFSGNATSAPSNDAGSNEADEDDGVEEPSSPSLKRSQESGITTVHEVKCKLYVKSSDPADQDAWKDRGMGHLSIKCREGFDKGTKESKPTIVMRNDVGKLLLNASLYPGIKTNLQKNSIVIILHTADSDNNNTAVAHTFLIRTKNEEARDKLAAAIEECAPAT